MRPPAIAVQVLAILYIPISIGIAVAVAALGGHWVKGAMLAFAPALLVFLAYALQAPARDVIEKKRMEAIHRLGNYVFWGGIIASQLLPFLFPTNVGKGIRLMIFTAYIGATIAIETYAKSLTTKV